MTTQQKAREFWIDRREHSGHRAQGRTGRHTAWSRNKFDVPDHFKIHVIEHSAYQKAVDGLRQVALGKNSEGIVSPCTMNEEAKRILKELGEM